MASSGREALVHPLVRLLDAEQRQLERAAGGLQGDAVAGERAPQGGHEARGQALAARLGLVHVPPQLLERRLAGHPPAPAPAEERLEIGERLQRRLLGGQRRRLGQRDRGGQRLPAGAELLRLGAAHVEPEQELGHLGEGGQVAVQRLLGRRRARAQHEGLGRRVGPHRALLERVDPQERGTGVDLAVHHRQELAHHAGGGRLHLDLHLHRLDARHRLALGHLLAGLHRQRHHHRRHGRDDEAARIADEGVAHAVHQHVQPVALRHGEDAVALPLPEEPPLVHPQPLHLHLRGRAAGGGDAVGTRAGLPDVEAVGVEPVEQLDGAPGGGAHPRPAAARLGHEAGALQLELRVVRLDRRRDEGRLPLRPRQPLARARDAAEQPGHGLPLAHLGPGAERRQPGLGGAAAGEQDVAIGQRLLQADERLGPPLAPRHHRGQGAFPARRRVARRGRQVGPHAQARGQAQQLDHPRVGHRAGVRILGLDARREGVPAQGPVLPQRRAQRHPQRHADEVDARQGLHGRGRAGEGVQAGDGQGARVEDELHGADAHPACDVAGMHGQCARGRLGGRVERGAGRLGQDGHAAADERGLAHAHHARLPGAVAGHHHLDQVGIGGGRARQRDRRAEAARQPLQPLRRGQRPERGRVGAEVAHALAGAGLGEVGPLRQGGGAQPGAVGPRRAQRLPQRASQLHRLVGVPHPPRQPVPRHVDRHRRRGLAGARQLVHGPQHAERALAAIDHRHPPQPGAVHAILPVHSR